MSEPTKAVSLDSNAYFRLGVSIRPLLQGSFGSAPKYSLYVLAALDNEYRSSQRLRTKFEWVGKTEYVQDRAAKRYELHGESKAQADNVVSFLAKYADEHGLSVSLVDLKALAAGYVQEIPVVTDDINMTKVAEVHGIEIWHTVKLLKVMHSGNRIDLEKVTEVLEYWEYEIDFPMRLDKLRTVFKEYFGIDCPV